MMDAEISPQNAEKWRIRGIMGKTEYRTLTYSVNGEFITNLARERLYSNGKANHAMELLLSCMAGSDLSEIELREKAYSILDGYAELKGTFPGDDYGYYERDEKDPKWDLLGHIEKLAEKNKKIQEELDRMTERCCLAMERLTEREQREIAVEMGDELKCDIDTYRSQMLDSFLKRASDTEEHSTEDYGWLEPDGTFHEVEWGEHQNWAEEYLKKKYPNAAEDSNVVMQAKCNVGLIGAGDWLVERRWVLLHSPSQGIAIPTKNPIKGYTKAQKEFLYDYYMERDCKREANAVFGDDD